MRRSATGKVLIIACLLAFAALGTAIAGWPDSTNIQKIVYVDGSDWPIPASTVELYSMNPDGSGAKRLTDSAAPDYRPVIAPDGHTVVYASKKDGDFDIYTLDMRAANPEDTSTKLTHNDVRDQAPTVGPDGTVYYSSVVDGQAEIFSIPIEGGTPVRLTSNNIWDHMPTVSKDGQMIAFVSDPGNLGPGGWEIFLMDPDGSNIRRFTSNNYRDRNPAFSPDGGILVWDSMRIQNTDGHLRAMDISSNTQTPGAIFDLTPYVPVDVMDAYATFSPDGQKIAFSSNRHAESLAISTSDFEIYVGDLDASPGSMTLSNVTTITDSASWSHQTDWGLTDQVLTPETIGSVIEDAFGSGLIKTRGITEALQGHFASYFDAQRNSGSHVAGFIDQQERLDKIDSQTADLLRSYLAGN